MLFFCSEYRPNLTVWVRPQTLALHILIGEKLKFLLHVYSGVVFKQSEEELILKPEVTIVIVSYNTCDVLQKCLEKTFLGVQGIESEIIVVDNASTDHSVEMVHQRFPSVRIFPSRVNLGFAAANNLAFKVARAPYIVLLNSDCFLHEGSLKTALERIRKNPKIGMAGGRLIGQDGERQPSARDFPNLFNEVLQMTGLSTAFPKSKFFAKAGGYYYPEKECYQTDWVTGAFGIARRSALREIGYFDERFFMYLEEVDLCKRLKEHGYEIWYWGDIVLTHLGGESIKSVVAQKKEFVASQLLKWQLMSSHLYYTKHFGKWTAAFRKWATSGWHRLRLLKNSLWNDLQSKIKVEESKYFLKANQSAWKETKGGEYSPPHPWQK